MQEACLASTVLNGISISNISFSFGPTQPPIQWVPGSLSQGVKRLGHKTDHSPPSNVEVKNGGAIPSLPNMYSWHGN
jgi:hypothetical protein